MFFRKTKSDSHPARIRSVSVFLSLLLLIPIFLIGCGKKEETKSVTLLALDTYVSLSVTGKEAQAALDAATEKIASLEDSFSRTRENSEIHALNHSSESSPVTLSKETYGLLERTIALAKESEGVFDPTIGPIMDLWGFGQDKPGSGEKNDVRKIPEETAISQALQNVDCRKIHLLSEQKAYIEEGVVVDLGGVAKGYIADALMKEIQRFDVSRVILDLGGNVCAFDMAKALVIGVISPKDNSRLAATVDLPKAKTGSVITSGAYERYHEIDGVRYGHIMDTKTGRPVETDLLSATVISEDGTKGDVMSTVLFAMGRQGATDFAAKNCVSCILCEESGTMWVSADLKGKVHEQDGWTIRYFG